MPSRLGVPMDVRRSLHARWLHGFSLGVAIVLGAGFLIPAPTSSASEVDPLARLLLPWWLLGIVCMLAGWWLQVLSGLPPYPVPMRFDITDRDDLTIPLVAWPIPSDPLDDLTIPCTSTL